MLSLANKFITLSVVILNVVMLSVLAPFNFVSKFGINVAHLKQFDSNNFKNIYSLYFLFLSLWFSKLFSYFNINIIWIWTLTYSKPLTFLSFLKNILSNFSFSPSLFFGSKTLNLEVVFYIIHNQRFISFIAKN